MSRSVRTFIGLSALTLAVAVGCTPASPPTADPRVDTPDPRAITSWLYQLQGYEDARLDAVARAPHQLAVIDIARDGGADVFRAEEVELVRRSGKTVLAYFEIGSLERFRPEYREVRDRAGDLILNQLPDWPDEDFVRYWDPRWWELVVRSRVDQALAAGFDGLYLDTPLAYEELDLDLAPGQSRDSLARAMVALIARISEYAKARRPDFWIVPQNAPELRRYPGYLTAIDGIGVEELFVVATDRACTMDYCAENLAHIQALRDAGKVVLAVDYATRPELSRDACKRYRAERLVGYVADLDLDGIRPPCPV